MHARLPLAALVVFVGCTAVREPAAVRPSGTVHADALTCTATEGYYVGPGCCPGLSACVKPGTQGLRCWRDCSGAPSSPTPTRTPGSSGTVRPPTVQPTAPPTAPPPSGACGTAEQMSAPTLSVPSDYNLRQLQKYACKVFRGCTATQFGRRMIEDGFSAGITSIMALLADVPACTDAMKRHWEGLYGCGDPKKAAEGGSCRSTFNTFDTTHPYNDPSDPSFSGWTRAADCRDYSKKLRALEDAHACLTSERGKRDCAVSFLAKPAALHVLAIKIVDNACVNDPSVVAVPNRQEFKSQRGGIGEIQTDCLDGRRGFDVQGNATPCKTINAPPLTAQDLANLQATVDAHAVHTEQVCGHHVTYHGPSVDQALLAWISGSRNEEELAWRQLEPFCRGAHPEKSIADQCTLLRFAHDLWVSWADAERAQDARLAHRRGKAHRDVHAMLCLPPNPANYYVTLPFDDRPMSDQPVLTMRQAIDRYRAEHPEHREELRHLMEMH